MPLSCSVSSVPETRNFTVSVTVPDNAYRLWVKWYSSANSTGAGVDVNAANPLEDDDGTRLADEINPAIGLHAPFTVTAPRATCT